MSEWQDGTRGEGSPASHPTEPETEALGTAPAEAKAEALEAGGPGAAGAPASAPTDAPEDAPRTRRAPRGTAPPKPTAADDPRAARFEPAQRLLVLDAWQRSTLPATEFAPLVGLSHHTLYAWKKRFEEEGPAGLENRPRPALKGSRLPESTQRAILMIKQSHPDWGADRIHLLLLRSDGCFASPGAIARVLREAGYDTAERVEAEPHEPPVRHFERSRPNQLWQSDLFTFLLKRENRRVHVVVYLDDYSRFVSGWGLRASASGALVRETFESAVANFGAPEEVLTDQGAQYHSWRGKSAFTKLLERRGVRHLTARPRHPQTLGKVERFWGSLWRECIEPAIFRGLDEARDRVGHFVDHYNFQRPHQGIEGLVPADRYFEAAPEVRRTLEARVAQNALDLAIHGTPRKVFYLTGRIGDEGISLHGEGSRVILTREDGRREEVDLGAPGKRVEPGHEPAMPEPVSAPGTSPLDDALERLEEAGIETRGEEDPS